MRLACLSLSLLGCTTGSAIHLCDLAIDLPTAMSLHSSASGGPSCIVSDLGNVIAVQIGDLEEGPHRIDLSIDRQDGTFTMRYIDRELGVDCARWNGTSKWLTPLPDWRISIDAECTDATDRGVQLRGSVSGHFAF